MGDTAHGAFYEVTINSIGALDQVGPSAHAPMIPPPNGDRFVLVEYTVANTGTAQIELPDVGFSLSTADGLTISVDASDDLVKKADQCPGFPADSVFPTVLPGATRQSCALFAVPQAASLSSITLDTVAFYTFQPAPPAGADGAKIVFLAA